MATLLIATTYGCRVFTETVEAEVELPGRSIGPLAKDRRQVVAIVDGSEIWRRKNTGQWMKIATAPIPLQSIVAINDTIYAGGMDEAVILRICSEGVVERLTGFDQTPGRREWIANGPPLGVRSLAANENAVLAAVHVGGIPRSTDQGATWQPTLPVLYDVHDVRAHPTQPHLIAAATAVGLCISHDSGLAWRVLNEGLDITNSLAVAVLDNEVLFSIEDGPFAPASQLWRWRVGSERLEQVRGGLPEWLDGKIDTGWIAAGRGRAAVIDKGGNLWLSQAGSTGWQQIATIAPYVTGLLIVEL